MKKIFIKTLLDGILYFIVWLITTGIFRDTLNWSVAKFLENLWLGGVAAAMFAIVNLIFYICRKNKPENF